LRKKEEGGKNPSHHLFPQLRVRYKKNTRLCENKKIKLKGLDPIDLAKPARGIILPVYLRTLSRIHDSIVKDKAGSHHSIKTLKKEWTGKTLEVGKRKKEK